MVLLRSCARKIVKATETVVGSASFDLGGMTRREDWSFPRCQSLVVKIYTLCAKRVEVNAACEIPSPRLEDST